MTKRFLVAIVSILLISSCTNSKYQKVSEEQFIGTWELHGRSMYEGMKIKIEKNESEKLIGRIIELNENKYVKMFADSNDIWVSEIKRSSNFQFKLIEKKIAKDLFSLYGLSTSNEFKVEFQDSTIFGLSESNSDPSKSDVVYKRVE